jgi:hypothetical protein
MADKVHIPWEAPGPASEPSSREGAPQLGLTAAMALTTVGPVPAYR